MENFFRESGVLWLWERIKTLLSAKQDKLVSGTNIKTINGNSLLGSGDVNISGGSGGGDFDSSGTYPNLTAGKASKLATACKIGITGGATGTATNFDGSGNINIPVTGIDESYLTWTPSNRRTRGSVTDNLMKNGQQNSFAFFPPNAVTIEYTNDSGATWLDYGLTDAEKTRFLTPLVGTQTLKVGKDGEDLSDTAQLRITLDFIEAGMQLELRKIMLQTLLFSGTNNSSVRIKILSELYANYNTDTWDEFIDVDVRNTGWMSLPVTNKTDATWGSKVNGTSYPAKLRVVFYRTGTPRYNTTLLNMVGLSNFIQRGNDIAKYCWPCSMDVNKNATFPARVKATKLVTNGGTNQQVLLGDGSLKALSEISPITDADADILLNNHIHSINVNANGNNVNINVIESSKNGDTWETEDNNIPIPLATPTSAGVMSKEDKAKLDGNISIEPDSGMPDFIGDFEYSDVDYEAIIDLTTVDWINWVEGGLFMMNAEETWEEDNGDTSYHQCVVTFIYRSNGCIPISIVNTNKMTAKMSGMVITINLTEGTGELRFKQIKLI